MLVHVVPGDADQINFFYPRRTEFFRDVAKKILPIHQPGGDGQSRLAKKPPTTPDATISSVFRPASTI
jgi:hypothetical protein